MKKNIHQLYYTLIILSSIISCKTSNNHTNRLSYKNTGTTTNISTKNIITNHCRKSGLLLGELLDCVCRQRATTVQSKNKHILE